MMRSRWQQDIRLELMSEAAARQRCRRCGKPVDDSDDPVCEKCQYDDWHEEYPDIPDLSLEEDVDGTDL